MERIKGPDFPTSGLITGSQAFTMPTRPGVVR